MIAHQARKSLPNIITKFNIEAFQNESTKYLYTKRLLEKLKNITLITTATPDLQWEKIQDCIVKATEETLRKRTVNINESQNKPTPWFTPEIRELAQKKRKAYLKYITKPSDEQRREYKEVQNRVNLKIRELKAGYWERFIADMEHDIYGAQKKIWKLIRRTKKEVNELVTTNKMTMDEGEKFFHELYRGTREDPEEPMTDI